LQEVIDAYLAKCRRSKSSASSASLGDSGGGSDGENSEDADADADPESQQEFVDFKKWLDEKMPGGSEDAPPKSIEKPKACLKCGATSCDCISVCTMSFIFVIHPHLYQELTNSNVQYVNICYTSCGLMGPACPVPVPSCQCQGTQVASKLKAAREQIAQRLAELRKKREEKLSLVSWDHFWWVVGTG